MAAVDNPDTTAALYTHRTANSQLSSISSRNYGASVWVQETAEPTATPTAEPTAEPTPVQTGEPTPASATPAPLAGVLAGLAAAGIFAVRGRK